MEHPGAEELAEYIYHELPPARSAQIEEHLNQCAECRQRIEEWQRTRSALQRWEIPSHRAAARSRAMPLVKWAAAAAILVGVGYGAGRMHESQSADLAGMKSQIAQQVCHDLEPQLTRLVEDQTSHNAQEYRRALTVAASQLEARHQADYANLRQDVETVAVRTQEQFDSMNPNSTPSNVLPVDHPQNP
jgi:anti-sigma factor RsiW